MHGTYSLLLEKCISEIIVIELMINGTLAVHINCSTLINC
jgi:hypothetical protein